MCVTGSELDATLNNISIISYASIEMSFLVQSQINRLMRGDNLTLQPAPAEKFRRVLGVAMAMCL